MKIALLRKKYTFHGGAERFLQSLIMHLAKSGHDVHLHAAQWDAGEAHPNVTFHRVPTISFNSFLRDLSFAVSSYFELKDKGYDIIQSHDKTFHQDIYRAGDGVHLEWLRQRLRRTGVPGKLNVALNPYHWLVLLLERMILKGRRYSRILSISELVKRNIIDNYDVNPDDIVVLYNGVDLEKFHPRNRAQFRDEIRARHGVSKDETVALFVGSGFERKGVRFLIEALKYVKGPLTVLVVGRGRPLKVDDPYGNKRVIFCGPQKDNDAYYASADFFVFPTVYEPFGNVHLEALASGLPVITTGLSGGGEILDQGVDGYVVPLPEETRMIAGYMTELMDKERCARMQLAARQKAERFTFERHIKETVELYESIIKAKQSR